jgi:DNA helicase-4
MRDYFGFKSGQEVYSFFSNSNCEYSWDELEGLGFIHRSGGAGTIISIIGDIDDDRELHVTFKNSKFNKDILSKENSGKKFPAKVLNDGSFTKIFLGNSLFAQISSAKRIFKEKQDEKDRKLFKKQEEERIIREKNRKIIKQKISEINTKLQKDFFSADHFYNNECSEYITNEEYADSKIAFIKSWAGKNSLIPEPDAEQAKAIGEYSSDIQVKARAGSGKTRTVVNRAIFLLKHCKISPDEILILAFNRKAAKEIRDRFEGYKNKPPYIKNPPHILTFHAFAYSLVLPAEELLHNDEKEKQFKLDNVFGQFLFKSLENKDYEKEIKELMLEHFKKDWITITEGRYGKKMDEFIDYHRHLQRRTLDGKSVKSDGEKIIANFLFENGIKYYYEPNYDWDGRPYRPDFVIPVGDEEGSNRKNIVIEYFGLKGEPDYDKQSEEKRKYWKRFDKKYVFLEYSEDDKKKDGIEGFKKKLVEDLEKNEVLFRKLSEEEIFKEMHERLRLSFIKATTTFVGKCRSNFWTPEDLHKKIKEYEPLSDETEFKFLKIVHELYEKYLKHLKEEEKDDFDGLIHRAIEKIERGEIKFSYKDKVKDEFVEGNAGKLKYIFIDEFQDFSELFYRLKKALSDKNDQAEFFCVGDDWQAINAFAGSDLKYFENFRNYFMASAKTLVIANNYRSHRSVVSLGNKIMEGKGEEARDTPQSIRGGVYKAYLSSFEQTMIEKGRYKNNQFLAPVLRLVDRLVVKEKQTLVILSRTNNLPNNGGKINDFEKKLKRFLPKELRGNVEVSTSHSYKGNEADNVIITDATERRYPFIHPNWVFNQIFGDSVEEITAEEQRLFYVAVTRAKNNLFIFTETGSETPFLEDIEINIVNWEKSPPFKHEDKMLVKILNKDKSNRDSTTRIKEKLLADGFKWIPNASSWQKIIKDRKKFNISVLQGESWSKRADGVEVRIHDEDETQLAKYFLNDGKWETELDIIS